MTVRNSFWIASFSARWGSGAHSQISTRKIEENYSEFMKKDASKEDGFKSIVMLELYQRYSQKPDYRRARKQYGNNCPSNKLANPSSHSERDFVRVSEKTVAILKI